MKKIQKILLSLIGAFLIIGIKPSLSAEASGYQAGPTTGPRLDFNFTKDSKDHAIVSVVPTSGIAIPQYLVIGFDSEDINSITGIGFYITYLEETFLNSFGNMWVGIFGGEKKYGTIKSADYWVKQNTLYAFSNHSLKDGVVDKSTEYNYKFNAIGLMEDLIISQNNFLSFQNSLSVNDKGHSARHQTGLYYPKSGQNTEALYLSTSTRSIAHRKFYAIVPVKNVEIAQIETLDYYDINGDFISSGTNDGEAFVDENNHKYLDVKGGRDFLFAVNGVNAVLDRVEVLSYPTGNFKVEIQHGDWDYEEQKLIRINNRKQLINGDDVTLNWRITEYSRYVAVYYDGDSELLDDLELRFFYSNDNNKASWIVRAKDKDGKLLPPGIIISPDQEENTILALLRKILTIAFAILITYLLIRFLILIFQLIGSGRNAFGKRR